MIFHLIIVSIIIKRKNEIYTLINIRCLVYEIISSRFIRRAGFKHINILIRKLIKIKGKKDHINKIMKINMDINGY